MSEGPQPAASTWLPVEILISPFMRFAKMEATGGILLLAGTIAALLWANSPWELSYHALWHTQVSIGIGRLTLSESRHEWINDGFMSIFFFVVGLEIKREVLIGELFSLRQAAFPFIAALGGAIVPALLYVSVAHGGSAQKGWAFRWRPTSHSRWVYLPCSEVVFQYPSRFCHRAGYCGRHYRVRFGWIPKLLIVSITSPSKFEARSKIKYFAVRANANKQSA